MTLIEVCQHYLANTKANGAAKTYHDRADTLFDLCFGMPPEFRNKKTDNPPKFTRAQKEAMAAKRIHPGFGKFPVSELLPLHIDQWLNAHPTWNGGRRSRIQAVKRALNYAVEAGLIKKNPIRGYRTPATVSRVTYITPEQELACLQHTNFAFRKALRVCIRTGCRPSEFAQLTAKHVIDHGDKMEWKFKPQEVKTRKTRVVRIADPEIIEMVRYEIKHHRRGPLFRNTKDKPWTRKSLSLSFRYMKNRLARKKIYLDDDCCMYSTRHTFAKRTLVGHWTGRPTNIETLARLMGNSPQVCRQHYLEFSVIDNQLLWEAV